MNAAQIADRWNAGLVALRRASSPPARLSRWAWTADAVLAFVLAVGAVDGALNRDGGMSSPAPTGLPRTGTPAGVPLAPVAPVATVPHHAAAHPWQLILALLTALPLVARRRYPLAAFWLVIAASGLYHLTGAFDATFTFAACVIAAYGAVTYSPYRALGMVSALVGAGLIVGNHKASVPSIRPGLVTFLLLIPVGLAANMIHTWKQRVRSLEAEQEAATRLAVDQERSRIAQELHDVVTHNVSMMVIQAGAARKVMATAPGKAQEALLAVESGGRAAMTELRHVMGLLTMNGDNPDQSPSEDLAPPPGLHQVAALAARVRDTGVPVELVVTGPAVPLPAGVELAAYRVVQEALTNTVKHAVGAAVKIDIERGSRMLRIEVADTGGMSSPTRSGNGRGLLGLKERLAVYGGSLEAGEQPAGGFRLRAVIPLEDA